MCLKLCHFIRSKDFEAMKARKLAIWLKSSSNLNSRSIKIHKISIVTLVSRASTSFVENPIGIMQGYKFENQMLKGLVNTALQ